MPHLTLSRETSHSASCAT